MNKVLTRPIVLYASILVFGAYAVLSVSDFLKTVFLSGAVIVSIVFLFLGKKLHTTAFLLSLTILISFALPFVTYYRTEFLANRLVSQMRGEKVSVVGNISSVSRNGGYLTLTIKVKTVNGYHLKHSLNARCSVYTENTAREGDGFQTNAVLEKPQNSADTKFDTVTYLRSKNIFLLLSDAYSLRTSSGKTGFLSAIKQSVKDTVLRYVKDGFDYSASPLATGLLIGETDKISSQTKDDFRRSGISHILSVSGLHLAILMAFLNQLLSYLRIPKKLSVMILLVFVLFPVAIAGFTTSVLRAGIMLFLYYFSFYLRKTPDSLSALFTAMSILCLFSPYSVFDVGAQLSFLATLGILACAPLCTKIKGVFSKHKTVSVLLESLLVTVSAVIFTMPISANAFGEISIVTFICNLVIIPPVTVALILIYLLVGLSFVPFTSFLLSFFGFLISNLLNTITYCAHFFASFRWASIPAYGTELMVYLFLAAIIVFCVVLSISGKPYQTKYLIPFFALSVVFISSSLCYGIYDNTFYKINYYSSYQSEVISVKLKDNGYLYLNVGDGKFVKSANTPLYDSYYGKNYFLVLMDEKTDVSQLERTIETFHNAVGISKLYLPYANEKTRELVTRLGNRYSIRYYQNRVAFGKAEIHVTYGKNYSFVSVTIPEHSFAYLSAKKYDASVIGEGPYDSVVFSPTTGSFFEKEQALPQTDQFYTRTRRNGSVTGISKTGSKCIKIA